MCKQHVKKKQSIIIKSPIDMQGAQINVRMPEKSKNNYKNKKSQSDWCKLKNINGDSLFEIPVPTK